MSISIESGNKFFNPEEKRWDNAVSRHITLYNKTGVKKVAWLEVAAKVKQFVIYACIIALISVNCLVIGGNSWILICVALGVGLVAAIVNKSSTIRNFFAFTEKSASLKEQHKINTLALNLIRSKPSKLPVTLGDFDTYTTQELAKDRFQLDEQDKINRKARLDLWAHARSPSAIASKLPNSLKETLLRCDSLGIDLTPGVYKEAASRSIKPQRLSLLLEQVDSVRQAKEFLLQLKEDQSIKEKKRVKLQEKYTKQQMEALSQFVGLIDHSEYLGLNSISFFTDSNASFLQRDAFLVERHLAFEPSMEERQWTGIEQALPRTSLKHLQEFDRELSQLRGIWGVAVRLHFDKEPRLLCDDPLMPASSSEYTKSHHAFLEQFAQDNNIPYQTSTFDIEQVVFSRAETRRAFFNALVQKIACEPPSLSDHLIYRDWMRLAKAYFDKQFLLYEQLTSASSSEYTKSHHAFLEQFAQDNNIPYQTSTFDIEQVVFSRAETRRAFFNALVQKITCEPPSLSDYLIYRDWTRLAKAYNEYGLLHNHLDDFKVYAKHIGVDVNTFQHVTTHNTHQNINQKLETLREQTTQIIQAIRQAEKTPEDVDPLEVAYSYLHYLQLHDELKKISPEANIRPRALSSVNIKTAISVIAHALQQHNHASYTNLRLSALAKWDKPFAEWLSLTVEDEKLQDPTLKEIEAHIASQGLVAINSYIAKLRAFMVQSCVDTNSVSTVALLTLNCWESFSSRLGYYSQLYKQYLLTAQAFDLSPKVVHSLQTIDNLLEKIPQSPEASHNAQIKELQDKSIQLQDSPIIGTPAWADQVQELYYLAISLESRLSLDPNADLRPRDFTSLDIKQLNNNIEKLQLKIRALKSLFEQKQQSHFGQLKLELEQIYKLAVITQIQRLSAEQSCWIVQQLPEDVLKAAKNAALLLPADSINYANAVAVLSHVDPLMIPLEKVEGFLDSKKIKKYLPVLVDFMDRIAMYLGWKEKPTDFFTYHQKLAEQLQNTPVDAKVLYKASQEARRLKLEISFGSKGLGQRLWEVFHPTKSKQPSAFSSDPVVKKIEQALQRHNKAIFKTILYQGLIVLLVAIPAIIVLSALFSNIWVQLGCVIGLAHLSLVGTFANYRVEKHQRKITQLLLMQKLHQESQLQPLVGNIEKNSGKSHWLTLQKLYRKHVSPLQAKIVRSVAYNEDLIVKSVKVAYDRNLKRYVQRPVSKICLKPKVSAVLGKALGQIGPSLAERAAVVVQKYDLNGYEPTFSRLSMIRS